MNKRTAKCIACSLASDLLDAELPNGAVHGLGYSPEDTAKIWAAMEDLIDELERRGKSAPSDPQGSAYSIPERESAGG